MMNVLGDEMYLRVEHDLRSSVPASGNVLCQEARVIVIGVGHPRKTKVTNLEHGKIIKISYTNFHPLLGYGC